MESVTRLFLVRSPPAFRGDPANAQGPLDQPIDGTLDVLADEAALAAMAPMLERLARRGPALIVGSPSERSVRVVRALADRCAAAVRFEPDLRPRHLGAWQGRHPSTLGEGWGRFLRGRSSAVPADVEPLSALSARVLAVLDRLAAEHPGKEALVVAHADGIRAAMARALNAPDADTFAPEHGSAVALDWAHPEAREFQHAVIGMGVDWDVAPPSKSVHRFPGGASVLPRS
jgi:broad specificity phosphatase PhoE